MNDVNRFSKTADCAKLKAEFVRMEGMQQRILNDMGFQDDDRDMCERIRVEEERYGVRGLELTIKSV